jgi:hypothetical protein
MNKYNEDFTTLPAEVIVKITNAVNEQNCTPVFISRLTNHPDDSKLFVVIAQYTDEHPIYGKAYVVWEANTFGEQAMLFYGHYGVSFKTAMKIVADKVRDLNKEEEQANE